MTSKQLLFGVDPAADWRVKVLLERQCAVANRKLTTMEITLRFCH